MVEFPMCSISIKFQMIFLRNVFNNSLLCNVYNRSSGSCTVLVKYLPIKLLMILYNIYYNSKLIIVY